MDQKEKFKGGRKFWLGFWLGIAYLGASTFLTYTGIREGAELVGLGTVIGGMAIGITGVIGSFVWGNAKEHQAAATIATTKGE